MKINKPKAIRLLEYLVKGKSITAEQISKKFDVANPHDLVYKVRGLGVSVATSKNKKGKTVYSLMRTLPNDD